MKNKQEQAYANNRVHGENRHVHYDLIGEWARTGKQVQSKSTTFNKWLDCSPTPEWREDAEYRFKPEIIRYKRYLIKDNDEYRVHAVTHNLIRYDPSTIINGFEFIKWIDTEWQEVEI